MTTVLAAALAALLSAAPPLVCPPGAKLQGGEPPEQFEAWCEGSPDAYGNLRRHGPARAWYDDGALHVEETWVNGQREGPYLEYHRNGRKAHQGDYRRDDKVGTWTLWFEDGGLEERSDFLRNVPDGSFTAWYRNGKKRLEGRYCLGAQCGTWITFDDAGREVGRAEFGEQRATP
jgi:antitoxin component YwqK of YwqJK toxin-antitoxin module